MCSVPRALIFPRPPVRSPQVVTAACNIMDLFNELSAITTNPACTAGCSGGSGVCPPNWFPGAADVCSAECGAIFEPFWDECGSMLTQMNMGGMEQMGYFYDSCLETLYPPGTCGTFCNAHTFDCFTVEVDAACCEGGANCPATQDVPLSCPVGCALVFPEFLETCRSHIAAEGTLGECARNPACEFVGVFQHIACGCRPARVRGL